MSVNTNLSSEFLGVILNGELDKSNCGGSSSVLRIDVREPFSGVEEDNGLSRLYLKHSVTPESKF